MNYPIMRYICDAQESGYGNAMRGYLQAFKTLGIYGDTLRVVPVLAPTSAPQPMMMNQPSGVDPEGGMQFDPNVMMNQPSGEATAAIFSDDDPVNEYTSGDWPAGDQINLVHLNPGMLNMYYTPIGGRYNIAITAWETDRLTVRGYEKGGFLRSMKQDINDYDEVWVPTNHVKALMEASGVEKPIFVIPHVLREEVLAIKPKSPAPLGKQKVGFYSIGPWNARKNHIDLVRAYFATRWTISDPVRLQLFSIPVVQDANAIETHEWIANDAIRELRRSSPVDKLDLPAVNLLGSPRPYRDHVTQAHVQNHCFITASRGEGFCLPALDAAALGNYVSGGFPALEDLARVAPSSINVMNYRETPITPMPEVAGYEIDHCWWETSIEDLKSEFLALLSFARDEGMPSTEDIEAVRETYCPTAVGKLIAARLEVAAEVVANSGW